jgi:hypothetical protein
MSTVPWEVHPPILGVRKIGEIPRQAAFQLDDRSWAAEEIAKSGGKKGCTAPAESAGANWPN